MKTATDLIAEAAQNPALDPAMRNDPREVSKDDLRRLVAKWRLERAQWRLKGKKESE